MEAQELEKKIMGCAVAIAEAGEYRLLLPLSCCCPSMLLLFLLLLLGSHDASDEEEEEDPYPVGHHARLSLLLKAGR